MNRSRQHHRGARRRLQGNAAIEFAILLPLLLYVIYALVSFAMMYSAQHLMTLAATEGARASLQYQPADDVDASLALRRTRACSTAMAFVDWVQQHSDNSVSCEARSAACAHDAASICIEVELTYPYATKPLLPAIPLADALMPDQMRSLATVQLSTMSLSAIDLPDRPGRRLMARTATHTRTGT